MSGGGWQAGACGRRGISRRVSIYCRRIAASAKSAARCSRSTMVSPTSRRGTSSHEQGGTITRGTPCVSARRALQSSHTGASTVPILSISLCPQSQRGTDHEQSLDSDSADVQRSCDLHRDILSIFRRFSPRILRISPTKTPDCPWRGHRPMVRQPRSVHATHIPASGRYPIASILRCQPRS